MFLLAILVAGVGFYLGSGTGRVATRAAGSDTDASAETARLGHSADVAEAPERADERVAAAEPTHSTRGTSVIRVVLASGAPVPDALVYVEKAELDRDAWLEVMRRYNDVEPVLAAGFGHEHRTNEHGEVVVPRPSKRLALAAVHGALHGEAQLAPDEPVCTVELSASTTVEIEVVDASGRPLEGAPVGLFGDALDPWHEQWEGFTGPDGRTRIVSLEKQLAGEGFEGPLRLALVSSAGAPEFFEFTLARPPAEPVRFVAGPTGRVVVLATDATGRTRDVRGFATLMDARPERTRSTAPRTGWSVFQPSRAGRSVFTQVGLGLPLDVYASTPLYGSSSRAVPGPTRPGEEVVVRIPLVGRRLRAVGTLGTLAGADSREGHLRGISPGGGPSGLIFGDRVAPGEAFAGVLGHTRPWTRPHAWGLEFASGGSIWRGRSAPVIREEGYLLDFGVVTLAPTPTLARGAVVDERGSPVSRAGVRIVGTQRTVYADEEGRFVVAGELDELPLVLRAHHYGYLSSPEARVAEAGATVTLTLRLGARLRGRLILPRGATPHDVTCDLTIDAPLAEGGAQTRRTTSEGAFLFLGCAPGTASFAVGLRDRAPVFELEGIELVAGETTRLAPVDLRGRLHGLWFTVEFEDREPVRDGYLETIEQGEGRALTAQIDRSGRAFLLSQRSSVDLWAVGRGARPIRFDDVGHGDLLLLSRPPFAVVRIPPEIPPLLAPFELTVEVSPTGESQGGYEWPWLRPAVFEPDGTARADVLGPGDYELTWSLRSPATGFDLRIRTREPTYLRVTEQGGPYTVELSEEAVREALERARSD